METIKRARISTRRLVGKRVLLALWLLLSLISFAGGVVTRCTEANLRAAMSGGGLVTFACDGTITLANTITNFLDTTLNASGRQITISGNNSVRVFFVSSNVDFTILDLTIANGRSDRGAGVFNDGGRFTGQNCLFAYNAAVGESPSGWGADGSGGALLNHGVSTIANSTFATNRAYGGYGENGTSMNGGFGRSGGSGFGGAICNFGSLRIESCSLQDNVAQGGTGGNGVPGLDYPFPPGANYLPGPGGNGGRGWGGAIFSTNELVVSDSLFVWNLAGGGNGGNGGAAGLYVYQGRDGAPGADGGSGFGPALFSTNGVVKFSNCTLALNEVAGGAGGAGGRGGDTFKFNGGTGGAGGDGGLGVGVIYASSCLMTNCTVASNLGIVGVGGVGGTGGTTGGIPTAPPGTNGLDGVTVGGIATANSRMVNTLLAANAPGGNCLGTIVDDGCNLSSDGSCAFTNTGSLNNTEPKLGLLTYNGGPTLTMALLAGSPAIDGGNMTAAPTTDQRGIPRPFVAAADIGAYEYAPLLNITRLPSNGLEILLRDGTPGQSCRLLTSTNFWDWICVATNQVGPNGTSLFQTNCNAAEPQRYYKAALP